MAVGMEKQAVLADLIKDRPWEVDLEEGVIWFGDDIEAEAEALGSEDPSVGTWLWAWANEAWDLPPMRVESALRVREVGRKWDVPELAEPEWSLDGLRNGHGMALVACGLLDLPAYYSGPAGEASALLVVYHPALALGPPDPVRATTALTRSIASFALDHRAVVAGYAKHRPVPIASRASRVALDFGGGLLLEVAFDGQDRVRDIRRRRLRR